MSWNNNVAGSWNNNTSLLAHGRQKDTSCSGCCALWRRVWLHFLSTSSDSESPSSARKSLIGTEVISRAQLGGRGRGQDSVDIRSLLLAPDPRRYIGKSYRNLGQLGSGSFGRVFQARHVQTREVRAVKRIPLSGVWDDQEFVHTELEALISLDHPNIVKFYEFFVDARALFMVVEMCVEGNFKRLGVDIDDHTEIKLLFRDLVMALAYCHDRGVVHRDLKFENCLIQKQPQLRRVAKVIDFGLAAIRRPGETDERWSTGRLGSRYFIAPEVVDNSQPYGVKCDCWAVGVMLYIVLTDEHPCIDMHTESVREHDLFKAVLRNPVRRAPLEGNFVDEHAADLVNRLLVKTPESRLDSQAALNHAWFAGAAKQASWHTANTSYWSWKKRPSLDGGMVSRMRSFATYSRFERAMLTIVAHSAMSRDVEDLRAAFEEMDVSKTGSLSKADIRGAIQLCSNNVAEGDIDSIFESLDADSTGKVQYTDWLAATVEPALLSSEKSTKQMFTFFDQDHTGKVSKVQLREMLGSNSAVCSALGEAGPGEGVAGDLSEWLTEADFAALMRVVAENLEAKCRERANSESKADTEAFVFALNCYDI